MARVKRTVECCSICLEEFCSGVEYVSASGRTFCSSDVFYKDGRYFAEVIMGHGCQYDEEVFDKAAHESSEKQLMTQERNKG